MSCCGHVVYLGITGVGQKDSIFAIKDAFESEVYKCIIPTAWILGAVCSCLDLMSRHMLSYMPKITRTLAALLCGTLRSGAYGTFAMAPHEM